MLANHNEAVMFPSPHGTTATSGPGCHHYLGFTITPTQTTLGRTFLENWSARVRDP